MQVNNTTVVGVGPGALEHARMLELENKLRETLGLDQVTELAPAEEVSAAPAEEPDDTIEAATPSDLDDPAFL